MLTTTSNELTNLRASEVLRDSIARGAFPGCAYAVGHAGEFSCAALGKSRYDDRATSVKLDSIFDLASLTKVLVSTTLAMQLVELGRLDLDQPIGLWFADFQEGEKRHITCRHLLLHNSGLPAFIAYQTVYEDGRDVKSAILREPLLTKPGYQTRYSDLGLILLGWIIETLVGSSLDLAFADGVTDRLGIRDVFFVTRSPLHDFHAEVGRFIPTETVEQWRQAVRAHRNYFDVSKFIRAEVHDPTAFLLGGVSGHAGLFGTVTGVAQIMAALVSSKGPLVKASTLKEFTQPSQERGSRALGWDTKSPVGSTAGTRFSPTSFGHTGFTGTSIWVDPERELFAILLTNRVHPTADNDLIREVRPAFHDAVIEDFDAGRIDWR